MASFSIVDSHLHLWDPSHIPLRWLNGLPALNKPHIPATVTEELKATSKISLILSEFKPPNVESIVYVETDTPGPYSLLEAEWVVKLANEDKRIQGLVAHAPVEDGEGVRVYLDALVKVGKTWSGGQLLKGVRRLIQSESPEFCVQPSFVNGVKLLAEYGLSFDICCKPQHLENVVLLVSECPNVQFILDRIYSM